MSNFQLNLQDTAVAFADKSNSELRDKHWLFRLMSQHSLVDFGSGLAAFGLKYHLPFAKYFIKNTMFKQFCGGESIEECETAIEKLGKSHIGTILDYSVEGRFEEEDFGTHQRRNYPHN